MGRLLDSCSSKQAQIDKRFAKWSHKLLVLVIGGGKGRGILTHWLQWDLLPVGHFPKPLKSLLRRFHILKIQNSKGIKEFRSVLVAG
jgi:hypothetical protein